MGEEENQIIEEVSKVEILRIISVLEERYGIKRICKVVEDAHRDGLVIFYRVGLVGKIPRITEKGKKWIGNKK